MVLASQFRLHDLIRKHVRTKRVFTYLPSGSTGKVIEVYGRRGMPLGISVSRTVSPSFVLLGFGGVYCQGHIGVTEPFFNSTTYSYLFTWNSSDLSQFCHGLYYH